LAEALSFIQQKNKVISHADLKYNESEPLSMDIILDLNEDGVMLRFEPITQKLRTVEIYDVPKVVLSYSSSIFSALDKAPTLVNIYERFGPTHPGEYDAARSMYYLHYPGLSFAFPIPKKYEKFYLNVDEIPPMEFPDTTTPLCTRLYLYFGSDMKSPPELPPPLQNSIYFEEVVVTISQGITFSKRQHSLDFNSTTQDVLSILGAPSRVFFKEEDKMKIHTTSYEGLGCADYFYNYFSIGLDILFDIHTHVVKKLILHTNFPTHYEFNQYVKCNFKIYPPENGKEEEKEKASVITPNTKWTEVQKILGPCGKPVVNNRGSNTNPFGATLFYGYKDIVFEVMKNDHIASVCLFSSKKRS